MRNLNALQIFKVCVSVYCIHYINPDLTLLCKFTKCVNQDPREFIPETICPPKAQQVALAFCNSCDLTKFITKATGCLFTQRLQQRIMQTAETCNLHTEGSRWRSWITRAVAAITQFFCKDKSSSPTAKPMRLLHSSINTVRFHLTHLFGSTTSQTDQYKKDCTQKNYTKLSNLLVGEASCTVLSKILSCKTHQELKLYKKNCRCSQNHII